MKTEKQKTMRELLESMESSLRALIVSCLVFSMFGTFLLIIIFLKLQSIQEIGF